MIVGAKFWEHGEFFSQVNNPTEGLLKKFWKKIISGYLETCGPTAAVNCLAALGYDLSCNCPGEYELQPEEILSDCMNDPKYAAKFKAVRAATFLPGGRIPQFYPLAVKLVFNATCVFMKNATWENVINHLRQGKAVQVQLKKPGHYIALIAYDEDTKEIIYKDSWGSRPELKRHGNNERMDKTEFDKNTEWFMVVYEKK